MCVCRQPVPTIISDFAISAVRDPLESKVQTLINYRLLIKEEARRNSINEFHSLQKTGVLRKPRALAQRH